MQPAPCALRGVDSADDVDWVVRTHERVYAAQLGWHGVGDFVRRTLPPALADHAAAHAVGWVAEVGGRRSGCVFLERDGDVAALRLLLVDNDARGLRVGGTLVERAIDGARAWGCDRIALWTTDVQQAARALYARTGFTIEASERASLLGHDVLGERWSRTLDATP